MCLNPKTIHSQGKYKETTYKGEKGEEYNIITYSKCGNCEQCIAEKANNWVIRNHYESKAHKKICFITLTYKDNTYFLIKKHLQDFIKRLRRYVEYHEKGEKLRYFAVGEYGERTNRPHFHIIIYNWIDKNAKYKGTNKKGNFIFESEIINKLWKFGLTSYQPFEKHEIPYIALYNTARDIEKRDYIISKDNVKKLLKELKKKEQAHVHKKVMIKTLEKELKNKENKKSNYIAIKEFNTWSKALGWEEFLKEYNKHNNTYDWKEQIEDKEFFTPSPWIIKLANLGEQNAIEEMHRRASVLASNLTEQELAIKNKNRQLDKKKDDIIDYINKGRHEKTDF